MGNINRCLSSECFIPVRFTYFRNEGGDRFEDINNT